MANESSITTSQTKNKCPKERKRKRYDAAAYQKKIQKLVNFTKYERGPGVEVKTKASTSQNPILRRSLADLQRLEVKIHATEKLTAKTEILLPAAQGLLEAEDYFHTSDITQKTIKEAIDITTAAKSFNLVLKEFGPYRAKFSREGRYLLLGGRKGHLAMFDFVTKKLFFEVNVMESIHDLTFLHSKQLCAVAQKLSVFIYDHQGIEIHCLKQLYRVTHLEFLPYHFLLVSASESNFIQWLDVTLGDEIVSTHCQKRKIEVMRHNPNNGVVCCGHSRGTVTMWTPNTKDPVATVMCHGFPIRALDFDSSGMYMATSADHKIKIWDCRNLSTMVGSYWIPRIPTNLRFSQKGLLAATMGNSVEIFRDVMKQENCEIYMKETFHGAISDIQFCPYEDILGVGTRNGFTSLVIPGSGEPNFDAYEANPFASKSSQKESEVKALLEKIPSQLITLDTKSLIQVDVPTLKEKLDAKQAIALNVLPKLDMTPRYRMKGKSGSAQVFKRKQIYKRSKKNEMINDMVRFKEEVGISDKKRKPKKKYTGGVLDRFL